MAKFGVVQAGKDGSITIVHAESLEAARDRIIVEWYEHGGSDAGETIDEYRSFLMGDFGPYKGWYVYEVFDEEVT